MKFRLFFVTRRVMLCFICSVSRCRDKFFNAVCGTALDEMMPHCVQLRIVVGQLVFCVAFQ